MKNFLFNFRNWSWISFKIQRVKLHMGKWVRSDMCYCLFLWCRCAIDLRSIVQCNCCTANVAVRCAVCSDKCCCELCWHCLSVCCVTLFDAWAICIAWAALSCIDHVVLLWSGLSETPTKLFPYLADLLLELLDFQKYGKFSMRLFALLVCKQAGIAFWLILCSVEKLTGPDFLAVADWHTTPRRVCL